MKNKTFSLALIVPILFISLPSSHLLHLPSSANQGLTCSPTTTGSWTISYSQVDPAPCGTMTITATYNNGCCPAPGDITVTKTLNSNVGASPNPVVGSIPDGECNFIVGYMTFTNNTVSTQNFRLTVSVTGGHTITNAIENTWIETCL
jgi:hypothetical protein